MGKFVYYVKNFVSWSIPNSFFRLRYPSLVKEAIKLLDDPEVVARVNYYCKLKKGTNLNKDAASIKDLHLTRKGVAYFFDTYSVARYFPPRLKWNLAFGDVNFILPNPGFTKSRPISKDNENSILLKLDKVRHFNFIKDTSSFSYKKDKIVFRGVCYQENRIRFLKKHFHNPLCNIGDSHRRGKKRNTPWEKPPLSRKEQLKYKFILSLEGNELATNLKWAMASNSLVFMPKPKFESWFMEDSLLPKVHYVEIKDDYSDLDDKLKYYIEHPQESKKIIQAAHNHVAKFITPKRELLIAILVLRKYFYATGQMSISNKEIAVFFNN